MYQTYFVYDAYIVGYVFCQWIADKKGFDSFRYPIKSVKWLQETTLCIFYIRKTEVKLKEKHLDSAKMCLLSVRMNKKFIVYNLAGMKWGVLMLNYNLQSGHKPQKIIKMKVNWTIIWKKDKERKLRQWFMHYISKEN